MQRPFFIIALALCALAGSAFAQQISRTKFFTWSGGFAGCSNCGSDPTAFACSNGVGNWNNGFQTFSLSDVPAGYSLVSVTLRINGTFSCLTSIPTLLNTTINGVVIDTATAIGSSGCTCNSCDGSRTFTNSFFSNGFPGKFAGANNYLQITALNSPICLSSAQLNMTFDKPAQKVVSINLFPNGNNTLVAGCQACTFSNVTAKSDPYRVKFAFQDPVPAGKTVVSISVRAFGNWGSMYGSSGTVTPYVSGQALKARSIPNAISTFCNYCGGAVDFTSDTFMFGWPNYFYGGSNSFQFYQSFTTSPYFIGMLQLNIMYI